MSAKTSRKNGNHGGLHYRFLLYLYPLRQKTKKQVIMKIYIITKRLEVMNKSIPAFPVTISRAQLFHIHLPSFIFLSRSPPFSPSSPSPSNKNHKPPFPAPKMNLPTLPLPPFRCFPLFSGWMPDDRKVRRGECVGEGRDVGC